MRDENKIYEASLIEAAKSGDIEKLKAALDAGVDLKQLKGRHGAPLVHYAAARRQIALLNWFLENGFDLSAQDKDGITAAYLAVQEGHCDVLDWLKENGFNLIEVTQSNRINLVHLAAFHGRITVLQWLLENRFDFSLVTDQGKWPVHFAVMRGHLEVLKWFKQKKFNLFEVSEDGSNVGHFAVENGKIEVLEWLLENGLDLNAKTHKGDTLLHAALYPTVQADVFKWLCEKGADVNAGSKPQGFEGTIIDLLIYQEHFELLDWFYENAKKFKFKKSHLPLLEIILENNPPKIDKMFCAILRNHPNCLLNKKNQINTPLVKRCTQFLEKSIRSNSSEIFSVRLVLTKIYKNKQFHLMLPLADMHYAEKIGNGNIEALLQDNPLFHLMRKKGNIDYFQEVLKWDIETLLVDKNPLFYKGFEVFLKEMLCNCTHNFAAFALNILATRLHEHFLKSFVPNSDNSWPTELIENLKISSLCLLAVLGKDPQFKVMYFYNLNCLLEAKMGIKPRGINITALYQQYFSEISDIFTELRMLFEKLIGEPINKDHSIIKALEREISELNKAKRALGEKADQNCESLKKVSASITACQFFHAGKEEVVIFNEEEKRVRIEADEEAERDERQKKTKLSFP